MKAVLLVTPDRVVRGLLAGSLGTINYDLVAAATIQEALNAYPENDFIRTFSGRGYAIDWE